MIDFPSYNCAHCNVEHKPVCNTDEYNKFLFTNKWCQNCAFWLRKQNMYGTGFDKHFVVDNTMYLAHNSKSPSEGGPTMRGHGGRETIVLFSNNTTITTTNLWCQGEIPEDMKSLFPVNAKFVYVDNAKWEDLPLIKDGHWK
jgi:hypothetical protein